MKVELEEWQLPLIVVHLLEYQVHHQQTTA